MNYGRMIDELLTNYWRIIDRPLIDHWKTVNKKSMDFWQYTTNNAINNELICIQSFIANNSIIRLG